MALRRVWWIRLRGGSGGAADRAWRGRTWSAKQLEAVDLPLVLPAAPGQAKAGANGGPVLIQTDGEALDDPHAAGTGVGQPSIEGGDDAGLGRRAATATAYDPTEPTAEIDDLGCLGILQHTRDRSGGVGIEILRLAQEMPRQLLR